MDDLMIKIDNVSKMYKLGQIGGTTIREELQRTFARIRGKEDPTKKIGAKDYNKGETFMALNGVSFDVKKGERIGIIGHNGAGKSTLLKLLSRVTAPTSGEIGLNGRVASMLEVGTGFHGELTGRENIYMNGAILGMTKKEIDAKMEDIIEFSECRKFIDTPVKRYSSGMYVKLAFSVAAHLDSEIMIMDEVLAVGDMAFQKKCLDKMNDVSKKEGRTILYVSHNMNTIRQLCERVIVLDHGKVVFDGDVKEGIEIYLENNSDESTTDIDLTKIQHYGQECTEDVILEHLTVKNKSSLDFFDTEVMNLEITFNAKKTIENVAFRMAFTSTAGTNIGAVWSNAFDIKENGRHCIELLFPINQLPKATLYLTLGIHEVYESGQFQAIDHIQRIFKFRTNQEADKNIIIWSPDYWGVVRFPEMQIQKMRKL